MITLALDLAGRTGWAIRYDTGELRSGIWTLVRGDIGGSLSPVPMKRLWRRLGRLGADHQIGKIALEYTYGRGAAKFRLDSLQYTAILYAQLLNIPWMRVGPSAWKKAVVGNATASRDEYLEFARNRWPDQSIRYDDQAAALCVLAYAEGF